MLFLAHINTPPSPCPNWIQIEDKSAFAARDRVIAFLQFLGYYRSRDEVVMILLREPVIQLGPGYTPKDVRLQAVKTPPSSPSKLPDGGASP